VNDRTDRRLAWGTLAVSVLLSAGAAVFLVLAWDTPLRPMEFGSKGYAIAWSVVVGGVDVTSRIGEGTTVAGRVPASEVVR